MLALTDRLGIMMKDIQSWNTKNKSELGAGGVEEDQAVCAALGAGARDLDKDQTFLAELGLGSAEAAALTRPGLASSEIRGRGEMAFKLRFRLDGRQRVKYLDEDRARRLEQTLNEVQRARRKALALGCLNREAPTLFREGKRRIEPWLGAGGYRFHGQAIRRPRRRKWAAV